jgi:hypothetical protein
VAASDLLGLLTAPGLAPTLSTYGVHLMNPLIAYAKREPIRVATTLLSAALLAVALLTGTPVAVLVGQVLAAVAVLEKVRVAVAPLAKVIVHEDDLADLDGDDLEDDVAADEV